MIKKILIAVVLFFLFISSAECKSPVPQPENIDFYPVADTYVNEKSNAMPISKMELRVGNQNTTDIGNIRSALKFNISEIPEDSIINEAHLNVYSFDTKPSWDYQIIQAYSAPKDWSESNIDWSRLKDSSAKIYESSFIAGLPGSSPDSYTWDITTMVQSWVNEKKNFGIILQYDFEKFNDFLIIYSSKNHIFKPYLSVSYTRTKPPLSVRSLSEKTNTITVNESTEVESIVITKKTYEASSTASLHQVVPPSLSEPTVLNDTLSNPVQIAPQNILPEITRHPQSQFKNPGTPVNFLVTASGTPPLLFQWQKDGENIANETSKMLTIESISEDDAGIFTCNVSNEAGSVVSNVAELYLNDAAEIIDQPISQSIVHGKPVTFSLATAGTEPLSYQWKKDHILIHGATAKNYTIKSVQKGDEGVYTCNVSNDFSNDISNDAILVVITSPKISYQPQSQIKPPGTPVTFTVKALPLPLSIQWLKNGVAIDGETYESYTIDSVSEKDEGIFTCSVSNEAGSIISNSANLFIKDSAEIIDHPISQSIVHGQPVTFSLSTAGTEPLSYQWKKDHILIHGATSRSYTIGSVQKEDEGIYTCEISNDFSNNISNDALLVVITPPQISQHPLSQIKNPGMPVTFSVIATGTLPFSFQWLKDGVDIDGETAKRYTIDSVSEKDEGTFTCSVANDAGKLSSKPAILTVNNPPEITSHPLSQTINPKSSVNFSVIASGKPPILFQWMKNGVAIFNAVTDTYIINSASEEDEGEFTCTVTNTLGSLTSKPALLSVNKTPKISHHPLSQTINPNAAISFTVKASGTPPLSYKWLKNGTAFNNANSDSYTIDSVSETDEGVYTCTVTNDAGSMTSNQAVLTLNDSVKIIEQPLSFSKSAGESVTFSIEATGTEPLSFQWEKNGHNIIGATSKSYTITSIQNADGGAYKCRVNNDFSNIISNRADLVLKNSAQINEHPKSQSKNPGTHVQFSVIATGTPPLFFQWQKDSVDIDGATSNIFNIESISENNEGFYSCTVSNDAGIVRSDDAQLFVNDPVQILKQPMSQSKIIDETVTFTITATGSAPLSFQWEKDHTIIPGATSDNYSIAAIRGDDGGLFTCKVSNNFSDIVSDSASLIVKTSPQINRHPQSQLKNPGAPVNFLVSASGTQPLLFQWQKNGKDINDETSKSFTIDSISENDEGFYSCSISNDAGSITSHAAELHVNDPVKIRNHPLSQSKKTGETVIFSVIPTGAGPWSFQWKKDHIVIPGATSETYTIDTVEKDDEGTYTCLISNDFSNDISNDASLVLINPPQIDQQPMSQIKNPGTSVIFAVSASGTPPFSYKWMKNGITINNADSEKYLIDSVSEKDEGTFTCQITNNAGSLTSHPAVLNVNDPVQIIKHPFSLSKKRGETVTFTITAAGSSPISFQWEKDHINIPGATSDNFTISSIQRKDAGVYACKVYNDFSNIMSENVHLILNDFVQIIQHPQSQLKSPGMPVSFSVKATGKPPLSFQWQKDGVAINGETSEIFTIDSISENNEGFYSCKVTNDTEIIISEDAELLIILPPQIKQQPEPQLINPGLPVTFSITASGVPPLSFQWQKDGIDLDGATSESYTIDSVSENNEGFYSCSVTNRTGSVTSKDAELFLNVLPAKSKVTKDHASVRKDKGIVSAEVPHKPSKTKKPKPLASTGISEKKESDVPGIKKQAKLIFKSLLLKPPVGQELYTRNGDTLTYEGVAFPLANLVSANLEDEQGCAIRDVSRGLQINRETGNISGSIFVGSFRGAETVHLRIIIQSSSNSKMVTGISNTLFLDQGYPTVQVTEPANHKIFNTTPIIIYGTASDDISGIAAVEISTDGGFKYYNVDIIRNGQWLYSFTPKKPNTEYNIRVRSQDRVGLSTESDYLTIHYNAPSASPRRIIKAPPIRKSPYKINGKTEKAPEDDGIRTYRIISLSNNNFQPADLFRLTEQMAIIVKGYGGQMVTLRIIDPSIGKIMFELSDFIPPHKNKMWQWKLSQTGRFQAALIVEGTYKDDIFFTIIE